MHAARGLGGAQAVVCGAEWPRSQGVAIRCRARPGGGAGLRSGGAAKEEDGRGAWLGGVGLLRVGGHGGGEVQRGGGLGGGEPQAEGELEALMGERSCGMVEGLVGERCRGGVGLVGENRQNRSGL